MLDRFGADAFRWYLFTSKQPWDGYRFSMETVGEGVRQFLLTLWNTYSFFVLYANVNGVARDADGERTQLDRWILSRLAETTEIARERLDDYDTTSFGPRDRRVRGRSLQLVRASVAPALLGRRRRAPWPRCASAS